LRFIDKMAQENHEEKMKTILEKEKGDFKLIYFPLGDAEFSRDNTFPVELPIKVKTENESLFYMISLREDKRINIDYRTSSWQNKDIKDLERVIALNETLATELGCSIIYVEMLDEKIADVYSKKGYDYFSKGYSSFGFKTLNKVDLMGFSLIPPRVL